MKMTVKKLTIYYEFLDDLRISGITNMFGARPYLVDAFPELDEKRGKLAGLVLTSWMKTFKKDDGKNAMEIMRNKIAEIPQEGAEEGIKLLGLEK